MSNNFKMQAAQKRAAVPQVDVEDIKPEVKNPEVINLEVINPIVVDTPSVLPKPDLTIEPVQQVTVRITQVDTSEEPSNRGFFMYPSRHRQVSRDLSYIEERSPWKIIEDALEEYVVKHYGKGFRRK